MSERSHSVYLVTFLPTLSPRINCIINVPNKRTAMRYSISPPFQWCEKETERDSWKRGGRSSVDCISIGLSHAVLQYLRGYASGEIDVSCIFIILTGTIQYFLLDSQQENKHQSSIRLLDLASFRSSSDYRSFLYRSNDA